MVSDKLKSSNIARQKQCIVLSQKLAELFSRLAQLNKKYTEPSEVLRALVDDFGNTISLGDQKDIGEFNLNFLERIEEGLGEAERKSADDNISDEKSRSLSISTLDFGDESTQISDKNSSKQSLSKNPTQRSI